VNGGTMMGLFYSWHATGLKGKSAYRQNQKY